MRWPRRARSSSVSRACSAGTARGARRCCARSSRVTRTRSPRAWRSPTCARRGATARRRSPSPRARSRSRASRAAPTRSPRRRPPSASCARPASRSRAAMASPFSPETREATLAALPAAALDLLVIGGGITGAGVARDAALRGLRVALVERLDWAAGTSSRSSKLIHGGVRYLEQGDVGLVREAATERAVLRRLAPHLALPVRLVMPTYGRAGHAKLGVGLWTFERIAPVAPEERHAMWSREEALEREPTLDGTRLHGAATFIEYQTCDARLVLETVLGAHAAGALCVSRVGATEIAGGEVALRDTLTGRALHARSGVVVNAAGPWVDEVRRRAGALAGVPLHLTRGIHLVVPHGRLPVRHIVVMQARDRRSVFAVPRGEVTYLGTTDTDHGPPTDHPAVPGEDADYLLDAANRTFVGPPLARADVVAAWAGRGGASGRAPRRGHRAHPRPRPGLAGGGRGAPRRDPARRDRARARR